MTSFMRPDERMAMADIEKSKRQDSAIKSGLKTAASLVTGAGVAGVGAKALGPLASKVMPFLNKYIPVDMALKGINKVSPELGGMLKKGMDHGLNVQDGLDFIKGQIDKKSTNPKEDRNIIQQYSPELHQFVDQKVRGGEDPVRAAALALFEKGNPFETIIRKIEKEHNTNWSALVQSIYGGQGQSQMQQPEQQPQQPQQGGGQGAQSLQAILQKINQKLGG